MSDQCAIRPDGQRLDESAISWYHDADDDTPMVGPTSSSAQATGEDCGHGHRKKKTDHLKESPAAEHLDEDENLAKPSATRQTRRPRRSQCTQDSDESNDNFEASSSEGSDSDASTVIDSEELAQSLPSKTLPATSSKKRKRRQKLPKHQRPTTPPVQIYMPTTSMSGSRKSTKRNPIYFFYEEVPSGLNGEVKDGSTYYCCYHGNKKVMKVTKKMKYSVNDLVSHLKVNVPVMYRLCSFGISDALFVYHLTPVRKFDAGNYTYP
ncbi:hypothetical protein Hypma_009856 [Hypsizygus marmoreus]|uniref:Uncharacterized protein n=1 Tax=Hypsizygus marmoreus TaxID=39966 RepID=A0A369JTF1_HYPMA|nr:hypothetical protein Hypma_009856 [Hypsizygus marmoreus]